MISIPIARLKMALLRWLMAGWKVCSASSCAFNSKASFSTWRLEMDVYGTSMALWNIYGTSMDLMGFNGIYSDLMGFYSDSMEHLWKIPSGKLI